MMLCSRPSFLRKNVAPVKKGAGIQAPGLPFVLRSKAKSKDWMPDHVRRDASAMVSLWQSQGKTGRDAS